MTADGLPDIYIVGIGIKGIDHVTKETEAAFRRSNEILAVQTQPAILSYLESLCPKVTPLHPITYKEGENRQNAYDTMSALVMDAALKHPPVTFALYGHPLVFVAPSRQILDTCHYLGLTAQVLPGISSLDTMLVDLGVDPALDGMQMFEATDVLVRNRPLQPDVPCLLWQVGSIETILYSTAKSRPERFARIKEHLLRYYPPDHEVAAVYSSDHPVLESTVIRFPLAEIDSHHEDLHAGLTLYIPPVEFRGSADLELAERAESLDHLREITEHGAPV